MNEEQRVQFILAKAEAYEKQELEYEGTEYLAFEEYPAPLLASISKKLDTVVELLTVLVERDTSRDTPVSGRPIRHKRPAERPPSNIPSVSDILDRIV